MNDANTFLFLNKINALDVRFYILLLRKWISRDCIFYELSFNIT